MKKYKNLYIAATSQHVGKTTSTLGLVSAFKQKGVNIGYCKPVGQKFLDINNLRVDKDAVLFSDLLKFELNPDVHSPVILGKGATTAFLDHEETYHLEDDILFAKESLENMHELTLYEGTGHPGVGSVVNLSNADVAKLVDAEVIMIVEGGIGNTIDMLHMCTSLFRERNVPISGVIINKVHDDRIDKIRHYVGKYLDKVNIPLLGLIPYDRSMVSPILKSVADATKSDVTHNIDRLNNKVEEILAGSLIDVDSLGSYNNLLLVVSTARVDEAIKKIEFITDKIGLDHSPLSGIVATGVGYISNESFAYINKHHIPLLRTSLDTYGSVINISKIEVKINRQTPWKVRRAIELINNHVDLDFVLDKCRL